MVTVVTLVMEMNIDLMDGDEFHGVAVSKTFAV